MTPNTPLAIVTAWHEAVNSRAAVQLLTLSDPQIEIVGPRGSGYGHALLQDWLARAGLALEILRSFANDEHVVVEQRGVWRNLETNDFVGEAIVASHFKVHNGRVTYFARYDDLAIALAQADLKETDER